MNKHVITFNERISALSSSAHAHHLATAFGNNTTLVFTHDDPSQVARRLVGTSPIDFSPNGSLLAVTDKKPFGLGRTPTIYRATQERGEWELVHCSTDDDFSCTMWISNTLLLLGSGRCVDLEKQRVIENGVPPLAGPFTDIVSMGMTRDGSMLACGGYGSRVRVIDRRLAMVVHSDELHAHEGFHLVKDISFSLDDQFLLSFCPQSHYIPVLVRDVRTWQPISGIQNHKNIGCACFSVIESHQAAAVGKSDGTVWCLNASTGHYMVSLISDEPVRSMAGDLEGRYLVSGGHHQLVLWKLGNI